MEKKKTVIAEVMEKTGLSLSRIGDLVGLGKTAISQIKGGKYTNQKEWESTIVRKLKEEHLLDNITLDSLEIKDNLSVDPSAFIRTKNVVAVDALGESLLDVNNTLNSSLGVVTGVAGYGKTTSIKHFIANHEKSVYVLYIEGYTLNMLIKKIAQELRGVYATSFVKNLELIKDSTAIYRKLLIIDEADRLPVKFIESLRGINEECGLPIMFVGESSLVSKMHSIPRIASRIRKPEVAFYPIDGVDIATFYQSAIGLDITSNPLIVKTLGEWAHRDFRTLVNDANRICQIMNTNGLKELNMEILNEIKSHR